MLRQLYTLRNHLEYLRLEQIDIAEYRAKAGYPPGQQHECYCIAKGIAVAIERVNNLIYKEEVKQKVLDTAVEELKSNADSDV